MHTVYHVPMDTSTRISFKKIMELYGGRLETKNQIHMSHMTD